MQASFLQQSLLQRTHHFEIKVMVTGSKSMLEMSVKGQFLCKISYSQLSLLQRNTLILDFHTILVKSMAHEM